MKIRSLTVLAAILSAGVAGPALAQGIQQIDPDQAPFPQEQAAPPEASQAAVAAPAQAADPIPAPPAEPASAPSIVADAPPPKPSDPEELAAIRDATASANSDMLSESARKNAAYEEQLARVRAAEEQYRVDMAEFERKSAEQKALADEYEAQRKAWEAKWGR